MFHHKFFLMVNVLEYPYHNNYYHEYEQYNEFDLIFNISHLYLSNGQCISITI